MISYLSYVIDAVRVVLLSISTAAPFGLVGLVIATISAGPEGVEKIKHYARLVAAALAMSVLGLVFIPDADTRKAIALELEGK